MVTRKKKRYHPYGCKRDKENVGYLGRMSDAAYNELRKKHNVISHLTVEVEKDKIGRISNEEYSRMQAEANMVKKVLGSVKKGQRT